MGATMKDIARVTGLGLATISSYLNEQKKIFEDELCAFVKEEQKRIDSMIFHDLIR
jgi:DNA-binding LacI/PurR family transcriptional regulator